MNKFLVLEGLDGSGKSTQVEMLKNYLDNNGVNYKFLHFPQTNAPYFGEQIARFLRGEFGKADEVDPYLVAMMYAGDRFSAAEDIRQWLSIGTLVVVDRYVMSNIAFQCAKLIDESEKEKLRKWIFNFEYNYYQIPKPSLSIFLDAPMSFVSNNLVNDRQGDDREYLQGKQDIHEEKIDFQVTVRNEYLKAIELDNSFKYINCDTEGKMKQPEVIFNELLKVLQESNIID
ncbi:MAG: dTMP kinase [Salinivirgaceae bacterium]|nr:MAG: dTMP kinase [Salinivirgaceae bacterium]